ncbi:small-conductance mechanosensitive channel domain protein [Mycobacterium ulcerans str. Harvey]|uniref:Small-conductance mechanosensitive channel domain protein n=1 Tax=Mycobacterium ulcerans str. Harvey TaxID=1299332 RepID=A0ABP3A841_MYCUL|nr:small-conductance mechanosensitive channel domain protein [Mycobacterium ulcerans str. Harvey]
MPTTYFTTTPFENWTRNATELLGTVELDVDFAVGLQAMRAELQRQLAGSELWDQRVGALQVTDAVGGTCGCGYWSVRPMRRPVGPALRGPRRHGRLVAAQPTRSPTALARCAFRHPLRGQPACRDAGNGANEQDPG